MDYRIKGKLAFVSAGAHGIGQAVADLLTQEGAAVVCAHLPGTDPSHVGPRAGCGGEHRVGPGETARTYPDGLRRVQGRPAVSDQGAGETVRAARPGKLGIAGTGLDPYVDTPRRDCR